jgi:hypothetical protein
MIIKLRIADGKIVLGDQLAYVYRSADMKFADEEILRCQHLLRAGEAL